MGELSKITWTHHTFNPWWGCQRVSPGCQNCYAEAWAKRTGKKVWGPTAPRLFFGEKHWAEPLKWNLDAEKAGERHRVFCASMADVFEDRRDLDEWREKLWVLIDATPWLDWLLLTKRPENIRPLGSNVLSRCWLGTTAEDQQRLDERVGHLLRVDAVVRFLSCEPLLGEIDASRWLGYSETWDRWVGPCGCSAERDPWTRCELCEESGWAPAPCEGINWVIGGTESGPGARPAELAWMESLRDQCAHSGVPFFTKQIANAQDRKGEKHPEFWPGGAELWPREFPEVQP